MCVKADSARFFAEVTEIAADSLYSDTVLSKQFSAHFLHEYGRPYLGGEGAGFTDFGIRKSFRLTCVLQNERKACGVQPALHYWFETLRFVIFLASKLPRNCGKLKVTQK